MWITNHIVLHRLLQIMMYSLGCIHSTSLNTNLHLYSIHYWLIKFVFSDVPKQFVKPYLFKYAIRISLQSFSATSSVSQKPVYAIGHATSTGNNLGSIKMLQSVEFTISGHHFQWTLSWYMRDSLIIGEDYMSKSPFLAK